jgi:5-formyltetrahydrofolate cyclo-ligase
MIEGSPKGKTLYVPKIRSKEGIMDFLRSYSADDLASFPAGIWGIREPEDLWEEKPRSSSEFWIFIPQKKIV